MILTYGRSLSHNSEKACVFSRAPPNLRPIHYRCVHPASFSSMQWMEYQSLLENLRHQLYSSGIFLFILLKTTNTTTSTTTTRSLPRTNSHFVWETIGRWCIRTSSRVGRPTPRVVRGATCSTDLLLLASLLSSSHELRGRVKIIGIIHITRPKTKPRASTRMLTSLLS